MRVAVEAVEPGITGNAAASTPLQLTSPILGLEAQGAADGEITGGAEEESETSLRARLLDRIRNQPSGGAARDYITWALAVPGVTRAWCYPGEMGRGSVTVRFVMDNTYADGIPMPTTTGQSLYRLRKAGDGRRLCGGPGVSSH